MQLLWFMSLVSYHNLLTIYCYANLPHPVNTLQLSPQINNSLNTVLPIHTINELLTQFHSSALATPIQLYLLPGADLIAIGRNNCNSHRQKLLKHADLTTCIQKNHIFLCKGHQVLNNDLGRLMPRLSLSPIRKGSDRKL